MVMMSATISCNNPTDNTDDNGPDTIMNTPDDIRNDPGADTSPTPVDTSKRREPAKLGEDFR